MAPSLDRQTLWVDVGELRVSLDLHQELRTVVGSCVAVAVYDSTQRVGGLLHAVLPQQPNAGRSLGTAGYVREGVPLLLDAMYSQGCQVSRLKAMVVGGGVLTDGPTEQAWVAETNIQETRQALIRLDFGPIFNALGGRMGALCHWRWLPVGFQWTLWDDDDRYRCV